MKTIIKTSLLAIVLSTNFAKAFCGFYVAKADASLYNNKSQIILVRDGERTTITMSSDYNGPVKDFAMVIPVPTIIKKEDIKIISNTLLSKLDAYSSPRMAEYYDSNPCGAYKDYDYNKIPQPTMSMTKMSMADKEDAVEAKKVIIEATYEIGEYEILILSATESDALQNWLKDNGYKIPSKAASVLEPYIKSNMKFFVVKVKLDSYNQMGFNSLRPIQVTFNSPRFMLPLRLGMANSKGEQDMIVYAFTKQGRMESVNYRTVKMPTDRNVPLFCAQNFGKFYSDMFTKQYTQEGKNCLFLEYAWNVTPNYGIKCDPCVGNPPIYTDLAEAGVDWLSNKLDQWGNPIQRSNVFFTRLHVRYSNEFFPQDIQFEETPNQEQYQTRYVIHHPATGDFSCIDGIRYITELMNLKRNEINEAQALSGWNAKRMNAYVNNSNFIPQWALIDKPIVTEVNENERDILFPKNEKKNEISPILPTSKDGNDKFPPQELYVKPINWTIIGILMTLFITVIGILALPTIPKKAHS